MTIPKRIQRRRTKGYRLPVGTVCVSRPGKWGNPFYGKTLWGPRDGEPVSHVEMYRRAMSHDQWGNVAQAKRELRGHSLACWCKLCPTHADGLPLDVECADCQPCHADVLLKIANGEPT